jgi:hypothetical protein
LFATANIKSPEYTLVPFAAADIHRSFYRLKQYSRTNHTIFFISESAALQGVRERGKA